MIEGRTTKFLMLVITCVAFLSGCEYADRKDDRLSSEQRGDGATKAKPTDVKAEDNSNEPDALASDDETLLMSETGEASSAAQETSGSASAVTRVVESDTSAKEDTSTTAQRKPLPPIADGPLRTVPSVDIDKYMGKWYEIARYDSTFQRGIVGVVAHYEIDGDIIRVRNTGFEDTLDGDATDSTAKAWVVEDTKNTQWKVQFIWPLKADYWVIDLGDDYEYAVVGQPKRGYLWILSRTPTLAPDVLDGILRRLCENGYDPSKLSYTPQPEDGEVFAVGGAAAASE